MVTFLKVIDTTGNNCARFVIKRAKLASHPEHPMLKLELCTAVLAVKSADLISAELGIQLDAVTYYSDSKEVLGYICDETRRYAPTDQNPADHVTRSFTDGHLKGTKWLSGAKFMFVPEPSISENSYNLVGLSSDFAYLQ